MSTLDKTKQASNLVNRTSRILVIDDTESIHADFRMTLSPPRADNDLACEAAALFGEAPAAGGPADMHDFVVDSAFQGKDGYEKVRLALDENAPYAVAFVDMRMPPGWDGLKTIEQLWEIDPELQVVICSAYSDYSWEDIIERLGINDRLLLLKKPFDTAEVSQLAVALTQKWLLAQQAGMKFNQLQEMVDRQTKALQHLAFYDRLTGLPNRSGLFEHMQKLISPGTYTYALFFIDFDRFKLVNDSLGHDMGDELLIQITARILQTLGLEGSPIDLDKPYAARLGGDEFVVVWPGLEEHAELEKQTELLLDALRPSYTLGRHQVTSTASIGITTSQLGYTDAEDVIRDADVAMYRAKRTGKDRACFFTREMQKAALDRLQLEVRLTQAFSQNRLSLYYQPIVDIQTGKTDGFESLLRWQDVDNSFISPELFIPMAEETGQIVEIGEWVLESSIKQLAMWRATEEGKHLFMSINLSKRQLVNADVCTTLRKLISQYDVPAEMIRVEITETAIMDNPETIAPILDQIRALGVGLSMDDFGKGHSSLNCLHNFPITTLKIDRQFIENLETHREYGAIIQAIVVLAKNMGVEVIAEGIETEEQLAQLQALDCDYVQGYYFGRPTPPDQAITILAPSV